MYFRKKMNIFLMLLMSLFCAATSQAYAAPLVYAQDDSLPADEDFLIFETYESFG